MKKLSLLTLLVMLLCVACHKPAPQPGHTPDDPVTPPADPKKEWMVKRMTIDATDYGGVSGKGKGAAVRITKQKILTADIPTPEDSEWRLDREGVLLMQFEDDGLGSHRTKYEMQQANFLLSSECDGYGGYLNKGAIWQEGMPPQVIVDNGIYLVRSASGEIVRMRVLDYQDNKKHRGYITIQYAIQVDKK